MAVARVLTEAPPSPLDHTFEAIVFDWDGTAVPDRSADASAVRERIEALCAAGVHVVVVSGTHVGNVDGQLRARPAGPGTLHLCLNRGSEVFEVGPDGPLLVAGRKATPEEDAALDMAAGRIVAALAELGVEAAVVSSRLNRRKIDLIPLPAWADPPKARIDELLVAVEARLAASRVGTLPDVVELAIAEGRAAGLASPRVTSDVKHVEVGLTDKSDSLRWVLDFLAARGIGPGLVLIGGDEFGPIGGITGSDALMLVPEAARAVAVSVGVEPDGTPPGVLHEPGGPARFLEILDDQLARRAERRVPDVDVDPEWAVELSEDPRLERAMESVASLGNGRAAVRGAREEDGASTHPLFAVDGIYTADANTTLLPGPLWAGLLVRRQGPERRVLDLRSGVLLRVRDDGVRTLRFVSRARPEAVALRAEGPPSALGAGASLDAPEGRQFERNDLDGLQLARTTSGDAGIGVATRTWQRAAGGRRVVERLGAWHAGTEATPRWEDIAAALTAPAEAGFDGLLAEHRAAWAERWRDANVRIDGDPEMQLAARFALFHLLSSAPDDGEVGIGARGLSGLAYGGHVFWDADIFVLPPLAAIRPAGARAMLEYRIRRLDAARRAAADRRLDGARWPWESAGTGFDVTPRSVRGPRGELIRIMTGENEEHIVADVAWAACEYVAWSGDAAFLHGPGADLVLDGARYWASRVRRDRHGRGHVYGVVGPDEYHAPVDDNAYTNVMARWNLRRGAHLLLELGGDPSEARVWREVADAIDDGFDPETGCYEQFAGYWQLEPLLAAEVATPPFAADLVLGAARVSSSQLIKQADVLMLHHLVPDEVAPGSLVPNVDAYGPRTAHGSSLSPAIEAAVLARAGRPDAALAMFRIAARLDLDDLTGTTATGLHVATIGGVWQALAYGFLGLRPRPQALDIDPALPSSWSALELTFRYRGVRVSVTASSGEVRVASDAPVPVRVAGGDLTICDPPGRTFPTGGAR